MIYPDVMWWSGNGANSEEKQVAQQMADKFIEQMKYPRQTQASL